MEAIGINRFIRTRCGSTGRISGVVHGQLCADIWAGEEELEEVATQLLLMNTKMRDRKTGLLYHGWDESKEDGLGGQEDREPGQGLWARAMGWYAMALMDVLERMPDSDPQRAAMQEGWRGELMNAVVKVQDPATGLSGRCWIAEQNRARTRRRVRRKLPAGNYLEASARPPACLCMRWPRVCVWVCCPRHRT